MLFRSAEIYRPARQALDDSTAARERLVEVVDATVRRVAEANTTCAPFDAELAAAHNAVKQAETAQRAAQLRVDQSGLRGRRRARTELAAAADTLNCARESRAAAQVRSRESDAQRNVAHVQIESARDALRSHDMHTKWRYLSEHLSSAEAHVNALDTWREWAAGGFVDDGRLDATLATLGASTPDGRVSQLLGVMFELVEPCGSQAALCLGDGDVPVLEL